MHRHGSHNFNEGRPNPAFRSEGVEEEEVKGAHEATQHYIRDKKDLTAKAAVESLTNLSLLTCSYFYLRHPMAIGADFKRLRCHVAAMAHQVFAPDVPEIPLPEHLANDD